MPRPPGLRLARRHAQAVARDGARGGRLRPAAGGGLRIGAAKQAHGARLRLCLFCAVPLVFAPWLCLPPRARLLLLRARRCVRRRAGSAPHASPRLCSPHPPGATVNLRRSRSSSGTCAAGCPRAASCPWAWTARWPPGMRRYGSAARWAGAASAGAFWPPQHPQGGFRTGARQTPFDPKEIPSKPRPPAREPSNPNPSRLWARPFIPNARPNRTPDPAACGAPPGGAGGRAGADLPRRQRAPRRRRQPHARAPPGHAAAVHQRRPRPRHRQRRAVAAAAGAPPVRRHG